MEIKPGYAEARNNLGNALLQKGKVDDAIASYQKALELKPDDAEIRNNLGNALRQNGKMEEAITQFQQALRIRPDFAEAHYNCGLAFRQMEKWSEAIAHFQKALQIAPANPTIENSLAWLLATCPDASLRNGASAVALAQKANAASGGTNPGILRTLAAAFAETGRFTEAVETAQRALRLAGEQSNSGLTGQLQAQLQLYQSGSAFHTPASAR